MAEKQSVLAQLGRFLDLNPSKPLAGSQIAFAVRTIKTALKNGHGTSEKKPAKAT